MSCLIVCFSSTIGCPIFKSITTHFQGIRSLLQTENNITILVMASIKFHALNLKKIHFRGIITQVVSSDMAAIV